MPKMFIFNTRKNLIAIQVVSSRKVIGGGSLAYRLDSTWKLIDRRRRWRMVAVPGSRIRCAAW